LMAVDEAGKKINIIRYGDWGLKELMRFQIIGQPSVFFRREVLMKSGFLDTSYHYLLDHHLWLRMAQITTIHYIPKLLAGARYHNDAKNISQAEKFGGEAFRQAAWMVEVPGLAERYQKYRRQIWSGAYCINGRYLSEAGKPGLALRSYMRSFFHHPAASLKDWRRVFFTILSIPGFSVLQSIGVKLQQKRRAGHIAENEAVGYTGDHDCNGGRDG
jgi:hypothetical protein